MIYVNKNKARIIVPRINQSPEYEQNKVVDIIVTNQVTKETRELQLIDESTDKNYYEFDNPLHYDVRGYEGTYDYKIVFGNGSVVLSSGIVVVEPDNVADNVTDVKSYEYYPDKIVQYTPNTEYVPQVESIKEIKINGDYWVKYYDRVIVDVPIPDVTEFEQQIENLNNEIDQLEIENSELTTENGGLQAQVGELTTENGELQTQVGELTTENGELQTQVNDLQTENTTLSNEVAEKEAYINTAKGITITSNGVYTPEEGVVGYNEINVEVEGSGGGKVVLFDGIKLGYSTFSTIPEKLDFSEVTDFSFIFKYCNALTEVLVLDVSNGTKFDYMFQYCNNLTTIGNLDTSNGTNFESMFTSCGKLTSVGNLDTSKNTDFSGMFSGCINLTSIPQLNTSRGAYFGTMFLNCEKLTSIPSLDTSKGSGFVNMFGGCKNLITIPQLNITNGTSYNSMFYNCTALENISFVGVINRNIDFSYSILLTYDSIKSILTACSNTTSTSSKTLKFNRTIADNNGELATLVGECTTKGWTITGLTLE